MTTIEGRWTCPDCPVTLNRAAGQSIASWDDDRTRAQQQHGREHARQAARLLTSES